MTMKHLLTLMLIIAGLNLNAQILVRKGEADIEPRMSRFSFCISLLPGGNSNPVSYGIHKLCPDGKAEVTFVNYDSFLRQFSGHQESRANPDRINYMEEYGITADVLKNLWKLRYASYPFGNSKEPGWGRECGVPTDGQMQILKQYGVEFIGDVIYGDNLINLLKELENPSWVSQYRQAR